jgi:hypothetical protein
MTKTIVRGVYGLAILTGFDLLLDPSFEPLDNLGISDDQSSMFARNYYHSISVAVDKVARVDRNVIVLLAGQFHGNVDFAQGPQAFVAEWRQEGRENRQTDLTEFVRVTDAAIRNDSTAAARTKADAYIAADHGAYTMAAGCDNGDAPLANVSIHLKDRLWPNRRFLTLATEQTQSWASQSRACFDRLDVMSQYAFMQPHDGQDVANDRRGQFSQRATERGDIGLHVFLGHNRPSTPNDAASSLS